MLDTLTLLILSVPPPSSQNFAWLLGGGLSGVIMLGGVIWKAMLKPNIINDINKLAVPRDIFDEKHKKVELDIDKLEKSQTETTKNIAKIHTHLAELSTNSQWLIDAFKKLEEKL